MHDLQVILCRRVLHLVQDRPVSTASLACGHFYKAVVQSPLLYFVENIHALFHAVNSDIRVFRVFIHRLDDTSCSREHSRPAAFSDILASAEFYAFFPEPSVELVEHQDRIHRIFFCRL